MDYKVVSKYVREGTTNVSIKADNPYTFITRDIMGDRLNSSDETLVQEVLNVMASEINPSGELQKLKEEIKKVSEKTNTVAKSILHIKDISPETMTDIIASYPPYTVGQPYKAKDIINVSGKLYEVIQAHTAQADWNPQSTPALYKEYLNFTAEVPGEEGEPVKVEVINDFVQPTGGHDAYKTGDKVKFEGEIYESLADSNAYSPTAYPRNWKKL